MVNAINDADWVRFMDGIEMPLANYRNTAPVLTDNISPIFDQPSTMGIFIHNTNSAPYQAGAQEIGNGFVVGQGIRRGFVADYCSYACFYADPNVQNSGVGFLDAAPTGFAILVKPSLGATKFFVDRATGNIQTNGNITMGSALSYIQYKGTTVSALNAAVPCGPSTDGAFAYVTDALAPTWNNTVVGGGAVHILALLWQKVVGSGSFRIPESVLE